MNETTTSKSWFTALLNQYKKPLLLFFTGAIIVTGLVIAVSGYSKNYVTKIIRDLVDQQVKQIDQNYLREMQARDAQIEELQEKLKTSERTYNDLKKRVGNVETKIKERKIPATAGELRDRLNQLGYTPVN